MAVILCFFARREKAIEAGCAVPNRFRYCLESRATVSRETCFRRLTSLRARLCQAGFDARCGRSRLPRSAHLVQRSSQTVACFFRNFVIETELILIDIVIALLDAHSIGGCRSGYGARHAGRGNSAKDQNCHEIFHMNATRSIEVMLETQHFQSTGARTDEPDNCRARNGQCFPFRRNWLCAEETPGNSRSAIRA